jgi:hypothetical protein
MRSALFGTFDGFKFVFMGSTYEFDLSRRPGKPGKNLKKYLNPNGEMV